MLAVPHQAWTDCRFCPEITHNLADPEEEPTLLHFCVAGCDGLFEHFLERRHAERHVVLRTAHHLALPAIIEQTDQIATVPMATGDAMRAPALGELARTSRA